MPVNFKHKEFLKVASRFGDIFKNLKQAKSSDALENKRRRSIEPQRALEEVTNVLLRGRWVQDNFSPDSIKSRLSTLVKDKYPSYEEGTLDPAAEFKNFLDSLESLVGPWETVLPVSGIALEGIDQLEVGEVTFTKLTPDHPILQKVQEFESIPKFKLVKKHTEAFTRELVAISSAIGEPTLAKERAKSNIERSINALRFYSCIVFPTLEIRIEIKTEQSSRFLNALTVNPNKPGFSLDIVPYEPPLPFGISADVLKHMSAGGFITLNGILKKRDRTEVEQQIINAVQWFGVGHHTRDSATRFVAYFTALDMLLSRKEKGHPDWARSVGERIAEAVAFLLAEEPSRRLMIWEDVKRIWHTRSNIVHAGKWSEKHGDQLALLETTVKDVIVVLLSRTEEFQTKDHLEQWLLVQRFTTPLAQLKQNSQGGTV